MKARLTKSTLIVILLTTLVSCKFYSFTGISTNAKTFQVNFFQNMADLVDPGLDRTFTNALQDYIQNQTNLILTSDGAELIYEGEIVTYSISPMSATASQTAAQNRLTIAVNVRFINNLDHEQDFEKRFSFYYDYPADQQINSVSAAAYDEIFERITQDIINESLSNW